MTDEPVRLSEYDATWPSQFQHERSLLEAAIGRWTVGGIEHVGSTAVPGMVAKPVIDIMAGVESLEAAVSAIPELSRLDYRHFPYRADRMHWFCKPSPKRRTHHLHLIPFRSRLWNERITFRDYLLRHPDVAESYMNLKRRLAEEHRFDREAYTEGKTAFVNSVVSIALGVSSP